MSKRQPLRRKEILRIVKKEANVVWSIGMGKTSTDGEITAELYKMGLGFGPEYTDVYWITENKRE